MIGYKDCWFCYHLQRGWKYLSKHFIIKGDMWMLEIKSILIARKCVLCLFKEALNDLSTTETTQQTFQSPWHDSRFVSFNILTNLNYFEKFIFIVKIYREFKFFFQSICWHFPLKFLANKFWNLKSQKYVFKANGWKMIWQVWRIIFKQTMTKVHVYLLNNYKIIIYK